MTLQIFSAWASDRRAAEHGEILQKTKTRRPLTVPWPVTTPSPGTLLLVHAEIGAAMLDEHVPFFERACVEQQFDPLAGGQLALGVLAFDPPLTATGPRRGAHLFEPRKNFLHDPSFPPYLPAT